MPRELETREIEERPKQWMPPEILPEPDKQPGFAYKWIRVSLLNNADARNIASRLRSGYEPVAAEEQPKFKLLVDPNSRFKDNIEIGGLLLCKRPIEFDGQELDYYAKQTKAQEDAVNNNLMRQSDSRMPLYMERKSEVTFGKGK
jgi:hypothetical protein